MGRMRQLLGVVMVSAAMVLRYAPFHFHAVNYFAISTH